MLIAKVKANLMNYWRMFWNLVQMLLSMTMVVATCITTVTELQFDFVDLISRPPTSDKFAIATLLMSAYISIKIGFAYIFFVYLRSAHKRLKEIKWE